MADNSILPKASAPLVDQTGRPTRAFYTFFNALVSNLQGQISSISKLVKNLALVIAALGGDPDSGEGIPDISGQIDAKADKAITITGMQSIQGGGDLSQNRFIYLDGDVDDVPGVSFYGSPDGNVKGWTAFSANFTPSMDADDNVTLDLVTVEDAGGGTLQRTAFDAYGRKTGTSAATTSDLTEGSNLYFTDERAQDAAGAALDGTGDVPLTYDDAGNKISAALSAGVLASLALADSATQPSDLATVATTGAYADLSGLPTLGTAAATDATDYATAAQGALADSAVQPGDLGTAAALNVPVSGDAGPTEVVLGNDSRLGGGGGSGDVVGPASATDGDVALFDGTTGKLLKDGGSFGSLVRAAVVDTSFKNRLINGDFAVNQRVFAGGALAAGAYGYDRWKAGTGGCNVSLNATTGLLTHTSGPHAQVLEAPNLAGKTVTVSVEDPSGNITVNIDGVSGTITSGSGRRGVALAVPAGSTGNVTLTMTATGVTYKRVQLEVGSAATEWDQRNPAAEYALCFRYFQTTYKKGAKPGTASANGEIPLVFIGSTTSAAGSFPLGVRMRAAPAVSYYDRAGNTSKVSIDGSDNTSITLGGIYATDCLITADFNTGTTGIRARFHVALDAEL